VHRSTTRDCVMVLAAILWAAPSAELRSVDASTASAEHVPAVTAERPLRQPNILWISAEDISAGTLGCYGGLARTPRLDALASHGLRFDAAFSAAPVCAPSRCAIITGMMPTTLGALPMRCKATPPRHVVGFPRLLRDNGYYCTNAAKTDYNLAGGFDAGWNDSGPRAHWRRRPEATQPFFAVFNLGVTHESGLFDGRPDQVRDTLPRESWADPAEVIVPPYFPDTPVIRRALADRLDLAAALDRDVGRILDDLESDGLADDTIVFFWGDHGEGIAHGKRVLGEHGLRVPLLVRVPSRFAAHATLADGGPASGFTATLVNLLDLGPTALDLAGLAIPEWMEGRSFLGPSATTGDVVIGVADRMDAAPGFSRSVRDARFRYVRNFLPWLDGDDLPDYAAGVPITGELRRVRDAGGLPPGATWFARTSRPAEELYDVHADPDQLHDLASDPGHHDDVARLRDRLRSWMRTTRDTGIVPEAILRREARHVGSEWDVFHGARAAEAASRYDAVLQAAWAVADPPGWQELVRRLESTDPAERFWAVVGLGWAGSCDPSLHREAAVEALEPALGDPDPVVRIVTARWMSLLSDAAPPAALGVLARAIESADPDERVAALVSVDELGDRGRDLWESVVALDLGKGEEYARRTVERIRGRMVAEDAAGSR
jgi:arylsulfatase A-like enzyme